MLPTGRRLLAALEVEGWALRTGVQCTFEAEVYNIILSKLLAERGLLATHAVEMCVSRAGFRQATCATNRLDRLWERLTGSFGDLFAVDVANVSICYAASP